MGRRPHARGRMERVWTALACHPIPAGDALLHGRNAFSCAAALLHFRDTERGTCPNPGFAGIRSSEGIAVDETFEARFVS